MKNRYLSNLEKRKMLILNLVIDAKNLKLSQIKKSNINSFGEMLKVLN